MASVPDPLKSLGFDEQFLSSRPARYIEDDADFDIRAIRCGVLFFMAFWSGPARQSFAKLKRVMAEVDPAGCIELVVIDYEGGSQLCAVPELGFSYLSGGYGETAWVRDGRIFSKSPRGFHPECFEQHMRALLNDCLSSS